MPFATIFCIDGSGNKNQKSADLKRPVYRVSTRDNVLDRLDLSGESAFCFFRSECQSASLDNRILIAADVAIGLPHNPDFPWHDFHNFPEWLIATDERIGKSDWRDHLIAEHLSERTAEKPFTKVKKNTKQDIASYRLCDQITKGESVYCIDSGAKQVGRASLQFWFEVLMPLRREFPDQLAIWPFEPTKDKAIVIAECYPTASQRDLKLPEKIKRKAPEVVAAILNLRSQNTEIEVSERTWFHAVSSEDEYDTFTTAYSFAISPDLSKLMWYPSDTEFAFVSQKEGWMLGLQKTTPRPRTSKEKRATKSATSSRASRVPTGNLNRNEQENLGPSGNIGLKGPLISMICRRKSGGILCGHEYETNAQDVFQKKCPACQGGK